MVKTRIRYIASLSEKPDEIAWFYNRHLHMEEIDRSPEGDISLSDGYYNFTLLKKRSKLGEPRNEVGLHHIGLEVESIAEVRARYLKFNPRGVLMIESGDIHHGEIRIYDPECNPVSLSEKGFGVKEERRFPRIGHVAFNALDPELILEFYVQVLNLREVGSSYIRRQEGKLNRFGGDGFTNLAIHPFYSRLEGHEPRFGFNHFGFLVSNLDGAIDSLSIAAQGSPRPQNRPYAEYRFRDPDGNAFDLSQNKGWEVDMDKWESAA